MEVVFSSLDAPHLEWARLLHNDPEVLSMLTDPTGVSEERQAVWFERLQNSKSSERWLAFCGGDLAGLVRLDQIDVSNKSVCIGLDIHKDFRGRGLAKPIYRKLFEEWFTRRGFNRVWLLVASYNHRARKLYKGLGFLDEGVQREALCKGGVYYDYYSMSILKKEFEDERK